MSMTEHYKLAKLSVDESCKSSHGLGPALGLLCYPRSGTATSASDLSRASNLSNLAQEMSPPPKPPIASVSLYHYYSRKRSRLQLICLMSRDLILGYIVPLSMEGLQGDQYRKNPMRTGFN